MGKQALRSSSTLRTLSCKLSSTPTQAEVLHLKSIFPWREPSQQPPTTALHGAREGSPRCPFQRCKWSRRPVEKQRRQMLSHFKGNRAL